MERPGSGIVERYPPIVSVALHMLFSNGDHLPDSVIPAVDVDASRLRQFIGSGTAERCKKERGQEWQ